MNVPEPVLAAMQKTNEIFNAEVIQKGNLDALDRIYTVGARVLPPGAPMVEGRDQIKSFWQKAISGLGLKSAKLMTVDAQAAGDDVVEVGQAELGVAGGQIVTDKYVVHWKQEDGTWKWNVDIWNANE